MFILSLAYFMKLQLNQGPQAKARLALTRSKCCSMSAFRIKHIKIYLSLPLLTYGRDSNTL